MSLRHPPQPNPEQSPEKIGPGVNQHPHYPVETEDERRDKQSEDRWMAFITTPHGHTRHEESFKTPYAAFKHIYSKLQDEYELIIYDNDDFEQLHPGTYNLRKNQYVGTVVRNSK